MIHEDKYDYSKVDYVNKRTEITIICKVHGKFKQTPEYHLNKRLGCSKCSKNHKPTTNEWIQKAISIYGDIFDYS